MEPTKKARISEFSKVAGYKINIQNSIVFLYTSNKRLKTEIKTNIIYNTDVDINLTKYIQDLCTPNYKTIDERIKD